MFDETMQNNPSHFLDHHSKLFFHHHIKMLVNFSENFFLNYKLHKDDSEKVSAGYLMFKLTQKNTRVEFPPLRG